MQGNSMTVVRAAVAAVLGLALAAGAVEAADRRSGEPAPPQNAAPGAGSTVGRPGPTNAQGNYQADYHADYRVKGTEAATEPAGQRRNEPRDAQSGLRGPTTADRLGRAPFGWPR
jgi:hypothetical protein